MNKDPRTLPLRDIHFPDPVSFWPPAWGWWLLAGIIVAAVLLSWWFYQRNRRMRLSAINLAREELREIAEDYSRTNDPGGTVRRVSVLLRRLSISLFPRTETASLTGEQWLAFLDRQTQGTPFTQGAGRILAEAPYRPDITTGELETLLQCCHDWIESVSRLEGQRQ